MLYYEFKGSVRLYTILRSSYPGTLQSHLAESDCIPAMHRCAETNEHNYSITQALEC